MVARVPFSFFLPFSRFLLRYPTTTVNYPVEPPSSKDKFITDVLLTAAQSNAVVYHRLLEVAHLTAPPSKLFLDVRTWGPLLRKFTSRFKNRYFRRQLSVFILLLAILFINSNNTHLCDVYSYMKENFQAKKERKKSNRLLHYVTNRIPSLALQVLVFSKKPPLQLHLPLRKPLSTLDSKL